ncbi:MAG: class I SAM-dependent methyltransferase [Clostridia bacterium]
MDREELRETFNRTAARYHQARPDYPPALYDALMEAAQLERGDRALEVGPATGKATIPLARRGLVITAVELGAELAREARRNTAGLPVAVVTGRFEDFALPEDAVLFDLVFAATSWHWIDPGIAYERAWRLLRPGGHLAFWSASHVIPDGGDRFFYEIQDVYDEIGEGLPTSYQWLRPGELPDESDAIRNSGRFEPVLVRQFDWELVYTAEAYIALLETFSGHMSMSSAQKERLYGAVRERLAARPDPRLRRHWGACLHVARRIP